MMTITIGKDANSKYFFGGLKIILHYFYDFFDLASINYLGARTYSKTKNI